MGKVLVTGSGGQLGSYMVDHLLATTDHLVYGMVRRTSRPDHPNLASALRNSRFHLVTGDLSDTSSIDGLISDLKPDYLINLACPSLISSSWATPESTADVGMIGVIRCLEAIRKHAPHCRFAGAGSAEEWGQAVYSPQDEAHPLAPRSVYGAAKVGARMAVRVYREAYRLHAIHVPLYNSESPRRTEAVFLSRKVAAGAARIARALKDGTPFAPLELGNLDARRDWSHARDIVSGIWMALNHPTPIEPLLASGTTHSIREFVELAFASAGVTETVWRHLWARNAAPESHGGWRGHFLAAPEGETLMRTTNEALPEADCPDILVRVNPAYYRAPEPVQLCGDATLARTQLGWTPHTSFPRLVREMVESELVAVGLIPAPAPLS